MSELAVQLICLMRTAFQEMLCRDPEYTDDPICNAQHLSWYIPSLHTDWQTRMLAKKQHDVKYRVIHTILHCIKYTVRSHEHKMFMVHLDTFEDGISAKYLELESMQARSAAAIPACTAHACAAATRSPQMVAATLHKARIACIDAAEAEIQVYHIQTMINTLNGTKNTRELAKLEISEHMMRHLRDMEQVQFIPRVMHVLGLLKTNMIILAPVISDVITLMLKVFQRITLELSRPISQDDIADNIVEGLRDIAEYTTITLHVIPMSDVYNAITAAVNT